MIGNSKLKTTAVGWLKMALKLALVMAHNALAWLYGCDIYERLWRKYNDPTTKLEVRSTRFKAVSRLPDKKLEWQAGLCRAGHFLNPF